MRLSATQWTEHLGIVETLVFTGSLLGLLLGQSVFRVRTVFGLSLIYTLFFIPLHLMQLAPGQAAALDRLTSLAGRLQFSLGSFLSNLPVADPILFITSMAVLYWIIALTAGFQMARNGQPWLPLLAAGLALLIVDFYHPYHERRNWFSGCYVLLLLLMMGRLFYLHSRYRWKAQGITIDVETGFSLGKGVLVTGLLLVLIAWNIPVFLEVIKPGSEQQERVIKTWETIKDRLSNVVTSLQSPQSVANDYYRDGIELGTTAARGNDPVFTAKTTSDRLPRIRFYWRGFSYDTYENGQWRNTSNRQRVMQPQDWPLRIPDWLGRSTVEYVITTHTSLSRSLHVAGVPLSVNRSIQLVGGLDEEGFLDIMGIQADPLLKGGEKISVKASLSAPTQAELRVSGREYPQWITDRYLQLPEELPQRIFDLAFEVAGDQQTPYDQVIAVTQYLRDNITYDGIVSPPPMNREPIDWFLFEVRRGFCNYYASAEVILLRILGIPARLAVGYAEGERSGQGEFYTVRVRDSHAWPEVYFAGIGWIEFEPTASQPVTAFPSGERPLAGEGQVGWQQADELNAPNLPLDEELFSLRVEEIELPSDQPRLFGGRYWLLVVLAVAAVFTVLWIVLSLELQREKATIPIAVEKFLQQRGLPAPAWLQTLAHYGRLKPVERYFASVGWMIKVMNRPVNPGATPYEQVMLLSGLLPGSELPARQLLDEYHQAVYSPHPVDEKSARQAALSLWQKVLLNRARRLVRV